MRKVLVWLAVATTTQVVSCFHPLRLHRMERTVGITVPSWRKENTRLANAPLRKGIGGQMNHKVDPINQDKDGRDSKSGRQKH